MLTLIAGEPVAPARDEALAMLELLDRLRADRNISRRRRSPARWSGTSSPASRQAETADLLGESKGMVQQRIAFFLAWARLAVAPDLGAGGAGGGRGGRRPAPGARRALHRRGGAPLLPAGRAAGGASPRRSGSPPARVEQDLRLFAAWVAAREARRGAGEEAGA